MTNKIPPETEDEIKLEKVIEWEETDFIYKHYIIFIILIGLTNIIFSVYMLSMFPEWQYQFFPLGLLWIMFFISLFISIRFCVIRKVYYKEVKE